MHQRAEGSYRSGAESTRQIEGERRQIATTSIQNAPGARQPQAVGQDCPPAAGTCETHGHDRELRSRGFDPRGGVESGVNCVERLGTQGIGMSHGGDGDEDRSQEQQPHRVWRTLEQCREVIEPGMTQQQHIRLQDVESQLAEADLELSRLRRAVLAAEIDREELCQIRQPVGRPEDRDQQQNRCRAELS